MIQKNRTSFMNDPLHKMPEKEMFTSRFEETRGGRVPQKSKIRGDVVYGWSLSSEICNSMRKRNLIFAYLSRHMSVQICQPPHLFDLFADLLAR